MKLTFHGGAKSVTGANYLLESGDTKILIDCGLHQGGAYCEAHNFEPFPYNVSEVEAVFISHAHIDHIGRLPQLYKAGFRGTVYSTPPTRDFGELLLVDSEHLLREEALRKHKKPLYSIADIERLMPHWKGLPYHQRISVGPITIELIDAGHVLGSSSIIVEAEGKRIVFSGDLGNTPAPFINKTDIPENIDYVVMESVYGNRTHENLDTRKDTLEDLIEETVQQGGTFMIPAFALERTQEMIFELNELVEHERIPQIPVFIDSPLAIKLTAVYQKYSEDGAYFSPEALKLVRKGDAIFDFPGLTMTLTTEQSKSINAISPPKVVIAGSGMSQGGRILHHEQRYLPDPKSAILFVGYQAKGSLGRRILDGAKIVKIMGVEIPVACKVVNISGYSAHADQPQLLSWLRGIGMSMKHVFIVQGEEDEAIPLSQKIKDEMALDATVPSAGDSVVL